MKWQIPVCLIGLFSMALLLLNTATVASAHEMKLTIYDDGLACPAKCDAHCVINPKDNGTRYAYSPKSSRNAPEKCVADEQCMACLDDSDHSCMILMYRGGGPPEGTLDCTPAFYSTECGRADIPKPLTRKCQSLEADIQHGGYRTRVNCLETPDNPKCSAIINSVRLAQKNDEPKREQCLKVGAKRYNSGLADPKEHRSSDCNYSQLELGGSGDRHWRVLLPAACRAETFVGRDGLDCCSKDLRFAASVHPECSAFFPN